MGVVVTEQMRVLTVRQPWAGAIIQRTDDNIKDVENRVRNIAGSYRGPVAIHAAARHDYTQVDRFIQIAEYLDQHSIYGHGCILGVVDLVDVHGPELVDERENGLCSIWAEWDVHHLVFENPRPLVKPIPFTGALGLRRLPDGVADEIRAQLSEVSS